MTKRRTTDTSLSMSLSTEARSKIHRMNRSGKDIPSAAGIRNRPVRTNGILTKTDYRKRNMTKTGTCNSSKRNYTQNGQKNKYLPQAAYAGSFKRGPFSFFAGKSKFVKKILRRIFYLYILTECEFCSIIKEKFRRRKKYPAAEVTICLR